MFRKAIEVEPRRQPTGKLKKLAEMLPIDGDAMHIRLVTQFSDPAALTEGIREQPVSLRWPSEWTPACGE